MDLSQLSDEELTSLYNTGQQPKDYNSMSNEELKNLYTQEQINKSMYNGATPQQLEQQGYTTQQMIDASIQDNNRLQGELNQTVNEAQNYTQQADIQPRTVLKSGVEQNVYADAGRGLLSGLTSLPRAIDRLTAPVMNPIANAVTYPITAGINKLRGRNTHTFADYSEKNNAMLEDLNKGYTPQTWQGQTAFGLGELAPAFLAPEISALNKASAFGRLGNKALTGGLQGFGQGVSENIKQGRFDPMLIAQDTAIGAGINTALPALGEGARALKEPFTNIYAGTTELLSGVPKDYAKNALTKELAGKSIFKGRFDPSTAWDDVSLKAQNAMNNLKNVAGKEVGKQREILQSNKNAVIDLSNVSSEIDNMLANVSSSNGISALSKADINVIKQIRETLNKTNGKLSPKDADVLNRFIQNFTNNDFNRVKTTTNTGDYILGNISNKINEALDTFPNFKDAKGKYSKVMDLQGRLKTKLKDPNIKRTLKNIDNQSNIDSGVRGLFTDLDELSPENLKFMDENTDLLSREAFNSWIPAKGYTTGGNQGIGNFARGSFLTGSALTNPALLPIAGSFVPRFQQFGIQGLGLGAKAFRGAEGLPLGAPSTYLYNQSLIPQQASR